MRGWMILALALCVLAGAIRSGVGPVFSLKSRQRVVFLGDSITNAGMYVQYVDAYLRTRFPEETFDLINLGLPSETISGLSEPDHPYPRPDLHERIARVLLKTKPDLVILCYGMNDGIYYPFAEERFGRYRASVEEITARIRKTGARVILMTPPPFDPNPVRAQALPAGAPKYSWMQPYVDYDTVLAQYAAWLLTLRAHGQTVVETHAAISHFLTAARAADPSYRLAGDGVHMNAVGHALIARQLLLALHAPAEADLAEIDARTGRVLHGRIQDVMAKPEEIRFRWISRLPMPVDPQWDAALAAHGRWAVELNRYRLIVRNAPMARYQLCEGEAVLGEVTQQELATGVDLERFPALSTYRRSLEVLNLVQQRERLLSAAWLTDVGHKRPGTAVGLPLAEAQAKAAPMEAELHRLSQPMEITLRLVPATP